MLSDNIKTLRTAKVKTVRWALISLCILIVVVFIALASMNSPYQIMCTCHRYGGVKGVNIS